MRERTKNLLLLSGSLWVALLAAEGALRLLVHPSSGSYGTLFGLELPPVRVVPRGLPSRSDPAGEIPGLVVDGRRITKGDLYGIFREEGLLGYVPAENAVSANGWWQSNNIGARSRTDTAPDPDPGRRRILLFGESFTNCSRVPQEETWVHHLSAAHPDVEFVNFGVDGYSIGQCLLRYRSLAGLLRHDAAVLTFVPSADLWRELNTVRYIGEHWESHTVMPRFVLEGAGLRLIRGPYEVPTAVYEQNGESISAVLREHLRRYDRFYSPWMYEEPSLIGRSVIFKLAVSVRHDRWARRFRVHQVGRDTEAALLALRIFEEMHEEASRRGAGFAVVLLPSHADLRIHRRGPVYGRRWREMTAWLGEAGVPIADLLEEMLAAPPESLDAGYDGSHYGPLANERIARLVGRNLQALGLLPDGPPGDQSDRRAAGP